MMTNINNDHTNINTAINEHPTPSQNNEDQATAAIKTHCVKHFQNVVYLNAANTKLVLRLLNERVSKTPDISKLAENEEK